MGFGGETRSQVQSQNTNTQQNLHYVNNVIGSNERIFTRENDKAEFDSS